MVGRFHEDKMRDPPPIITACSMSGFCFSQHTLTLLSRPCTCVSVQVSVSARERGKARGRAVLPHRPHCLFFFLGGRLGHHR